MRYRNPEFWNRNSDFLTLQTSEFKKYFPTGIFGIKNGIGILLMMGVPETRTENWNSQPRMAGGVKGRDANSRPRPGVPFVSKAEVKVIYVIICKITYLQSKLKANDFVTGVANEKRCLCSSRRLPWSSGTGWQVVSTTIFDDSSIFDWRYDARQIYLSRAIKNEGKQLCDGSSQRETMFAF